MDANQRDLRFSFFILCVVFLFVDTGNENQSWAGTLPLDFGSAKKLQQVAKTMVAKLAHKDSILSWFCARTQPLVKRASPKG